MASAKPVPSISMKAIVPHQVGLAVPRPCGGNAEQIGDDAFLHPSSSGVPFGQNQPISVTAIGIEPQTTAHGVKIDAISMMLVATAASSGQIELRGEDFPRLRRGFARAC